MPDTATPTALVGNNLFSLVTAGMYDNPLAIYREYIQNAADALAAARETANRTVQININSPALSVKIRDNGPGLHHEAAVKALLPIAHSQKQPGTDRGFRGVGRLSGLAFAQSVTFLTRSQAGQPVTRIVWDGPKLLKRILETKQTERAIRECVSVEVLPGNGYPDHFFEVEVSGVGRHAAGLILNRESVRTYIGEVCPVPMPLNFPFASEIENLFAKNETPLTLSVVLDNKHTPIMRPYGETIQFSRDRKDRFKELEKIDIPSVDNNGSAAIGWVAHSSYLGAIPKDTRIRGIRARAGNIQVGNEFIFDRLFLEERFNRWCVGEIHIVDPRIVPNGRRDYFEPGPHTRNLENQLAAVLHKIVVRCRHASTTRHKERQLLSALCHMEETYDLAGSGYLYAKDAKALVGQALNRIRSIRESIDTKNGHNKVELEKLDELEMKLGNFKARRGRPLLGEIRASEVTTYRKVFQALAKVSQSPQAAKKMIEAILAHSRP